MKIIAISDLHGNTQIFPFIADKIKEVDVVILAGDITHFGKEDQLMLVINSISEHNKNIFAVPGNCDHEEVNKKLTELGINISEKAVNIQGVNFVGLGGSLPCPTKTPFEVTEEEIEINFNRVYDSKGNDARVFIFHQPPYNTKNDQLSTGEHVGSTAVRTIIEKYQPLLCFTGHIHEGVGIDEIGNTKIVNPGPFNTGKYAYAEIENGELTDVQIKYIV